MNKSGESVILAIDPSFDHLAVSLFTGNHKVYVDMCSCKLGTNIGFDKVFNACLDLWNQLKERLDIYLKEEQAEIDYVISEHSPPVAQFSAGLFALDTLIFSKLFETYPSIKEIYILSSSYLMTVPGGKYKKSDSTQLAKYFINEILKDDIEIVLQDSISETGRRMKGTINNDKAESFLFLLRAFCKWDVYGTRDKIKMEMGGLGIEAEKLLIKR